MVDLGHVQVFVQILNDDSLGVEQVGHDVGFLRVVTEACGDEVRADVLGPAEPNRLVDPLLHEGKFTCVVDHHNACVAEVKLLLATPVPVQF